MVVYFGVIMIPNVTCNNMTSFRAMPKKSKPEVIIEEEKLVEDDAPIRMNSTPWNRFMAGYHRTTNAFTEYTARGFGGDVNSNFYEFLALGRVPYLLGSATFIGLFNGVNHLFDARGAEQARKLGLKFATGVVLYGLAKTLSKEILSRPIAWATGVDIEQPYKNAIIPFPKPIKNGKNGETLQELDKLYQHQKLFESREFPRIDMLEKEDFERIAKKNGLGSDLNCAEAEAKPIIKDVISTATTAERISSFLWAACGVCIAACGNWDEFYNTYLRSSAMGGFVPDKGKTPAENFVARLSKYYENSKMAMGGLKETFKDSFKEFYNGAPNANKFGKHIGKGVFWAAVGSSVLGVANSIVRARAIGKHLCDEKVIDSSKDSMVV